MNPLTILTPLIGIFVILLIIAILINADKPVNSIAKPKAQLSKKNKNPKTLPTLTYTERTELIENTCNMVRTHPKQVATMIRNLLNQSVST